MWTLVSTRHGVDSYLTLNLAHTRTARTPRHDRAAHFRTTAGATAILAAFRLTADLRHCACSLHVIKSLPT